ncbi:MAG: type II secretion system major pseudopilin GspG [Planctomycetota bacterium]
MAGRQTRLQPNPRRRSGRGGFTLIEVLLVLAILVVIASIAATTFLGAADEGNVNAAKAQVELLSDAVNMYKFNCKALPDKLEDLVSKPSDSTAAEKWRGPYLDKSSIPKDPWEQEYRYNSDGKKNAGSYDVWSTGPDKQDGSDDDIGNWSS